MKEWLKPAITESEAGMEVTRYLPAELDRTFQASIYRV
jgi:coenzyme PQQ precursor peptide PqqA